MKHSFFPGDKWLYFKIYCGQSYANSLLVNHIYQLAQELTTNQDISKWFFIRYHDSDFHIRFRIEVNNTNQINSIIKKVNEKLEKDILEGRIWKLQIEPYQREVQRYGENNIEVMEKLFWLDSIFVCEALKRFGDKENSSILLSMLNMDITFNELGLVFEEKNELVISFHNSLKNEYSLDSTHKKRLNKYYSSSILENFKEFTQIKEVKTLMDQKFREEYIVSLALFKGDDKILRNIYFGLNHMHCNRLFLHRQRLYEMICYDFLIMHYKRLIYKIAQN